MRVNESKPKDKHVIIFNDKWWSMSKAGGC